MSWGIVAAAGASIVGGMISSSGSKKAAATAAGGSEREIQYLEESRDLARADQTPYREAGYTALDALMSMTGLKEPVTPSPPGRRDLRGRRGSRRGGGGPGSGRAPSASSYLSGFGGITGYGGRVRIASNRRGKATGGAIYGRNQGGEIYNVNELGPERIYENGSYTRSDMPRTIAPSGDGYVAPNIQGRALGGRMRGPVIHQGGRNTDSPVAWGGPPRIGGGTTIDNDTGQPYVPPQENPGGVAGGFNFQTDPGYNFRLGEGMRTLERGAAARGGLLSGGYGRRSTRYAQDYASNEYTNVYNRIANIAGLGQVSAQSSGNQALLAGQGIGTAAAQGAYASAYGQQASGNAWANAANQLGQVDWGQVFNRGSGLGPVDTGTNYGPPRG